MILSRSGRVLTLTRRSGTTRWSNWTIGELHQNFPKGARLARENAVSEYSNYRGEEAAWWVVEVSGPRAANAMEEWFSEQDLDWFTRLKNAEAEAGDRLSGYRFWGWVEGFRKRSP